MTLLAFMLLWFFARNVVDGLGPITENGVFAGVVGASLAIGYSCARSQFRRAA